MECEEQPLFLNDSSVFKCFKNKRDINILKYDETILLFLDKELENPTMSRIIYSENNYHMVEDEAGEVYIVHIL